MFELINHISQPAFTCSKSKMETPEQMWDLLKDNNKINRNFWCLLHGGNYMFKVNNRNTKTKSEISS